MEMSINSRNLVIGLVLGIALGATAVYVGSYSSLSSLETRLNTLEAELTALHTTSETAGLTGASDLTPVLPTATETFLQIAEVPGEATKPGHKDWIEVFSIDFVMTPVEGLFAAEPNKFTVMKQIDKASPKLAEALYSRRHISEIMIELARNEDTFMTYHLEEVTITKIQSAGVSSTDPGMPMEEVSFSYSKITWEYRSSGGVVSAGWDLAQNKSVG